MLLALQVLLELSEISVANFTESAGFGLADLLDFLLLDFLLQGGLGLVNPHTTSKVPGPRLGVAWHTERSGAGFTIKPQHWPGRQLLVDGSAQAVLVLEFDCRGYQLLLLRSRLLLATGALIEPELGFLFEEPLECLGEGPDVRVGDPESPGFVQHSR